MSQKISGIIKDSVLLLLLLAVTLVLRWPAMFTEGFHNEDAAGIVYNADLILRGGLPYVDSLELKAPGSFFLVSGIFKVFGHTLCSLVVSASLWSWLACAGIYVAARQSQTRIFALIAGLLYAFASPISDSIDFNYNAWMMAPYTWCLAFALIGMRKQSPLAFGASGFLLAIAGLIRRQAAVLSPLLLLAVVCAPYFSRRDEATEPAWSPVLPNRWRSFFALAAGVVLGFAPIVIYYASRGEFSAFLQSYAFSESGWRYVGQEQLNWSDKLVRLGDGFRGFGRFCVVPFALAGISTVVLFFQKSRFRADRLFAILAVILGFAGAAMGLRFFKSYYIQILPAAVLLAADSDGALSVFRKLRENLKSRAIWKPAVGLIILILLMINPIRRDRKELNNIRNQRQHSLDYDVQPIAREVANSTKSDDTVWVWGRWAWPLYFHSGRHAPGRHYKSLGILTNDLTNTWRRPSVPTKFRKDSPWREAIAELESNKPAYILVADNESYEEFDAFKSLLKSEYVQSRKTRRFALYRHASESELLENSAKSALKKAAYDLAEPIQMEPEPKLEPVEFVPAVEPSIP